MLKTGLTLALSLLPLVGCAGVGAGGASAPPSTSAPVVRNSAAPVAPVATVAIAPVATLDDSVAPPTPGSCDDPGPEDDPRCPEDVLRAAAMSYLDKTAAQFDGLTVEVVEYDAEELMAEAIAEPGFVRILLYADATPADGTLDHDEVRAAERLVLDVVEARYAGKGSLASVVRPRG